MTITLGYQASAEQFAPRELVELAVAAEQHGFESVAVSDHFQPWRHTGGHAPSALAWMAAVGERTSQVRIGTSVLTPTFRYNPAVLAQTFATMSCLYPGRALARGRHRRGAQRDRHRHEGVAGLHGALRPPARERRIDAGALER
jgi:coenzyme F420-dependent glucose-6-phosphate dehydrogenase